MRTILSLLVFSLFLVCPPARAAGPQSRDEEKVTAKHYDRWLNQDVLYIITDDERSVFSKLSTPEERDSFIEEFWRRRSRNPEEFKEEHYRRIAYTNEKFGSGIPGWKTDRGRIHIMFGAPTEIEDHSGGENYVRKPYEGGGRTAVYPFQIWRYRHIDGIGDDIEIEFVDSSWTGLYKIALNEWEKDMLLNVDGQGQLLAERLKLAKRELRPGLHAGGDSLNSRFPKRFKDTPFQRMLQYFDLQRPPVIKHKDLQGIVQTRLSYNTLPMKYAVNYIWVEPDKALVPITMEIDNQTLTFQRLGPIYKARVALYGTVTALNGRVAAEFEDSIASEYSPERFSHGKTQKSMYQRPVLLAAGLYKLDLVVKDLQSGNIGTSSTNLTIPKLQAGGLASSPLILAKTIQPMDSFPDAPRSFVLGDLKVVPNVARIYRPADHVSVYLQVYNAGRDQSDSRPKLVTHYSITRGDKVVSQLIDNQGTSIEFASEHRAVLARRIGIDGLAAGTYGLTVEIRDELTGQTTTQKATFEVSVP